MQTLESRAARSSSPVRRWLWPAIVLVVGGSIAIWASMRETERARHVEEQVKSLCVRLAAGSDLTGSLNPTNPTVEERILAAMRSVVDSPATADIISVRVTSGDITAAGPTATRATHVAMLMIGDQPLLGLRVQCDSADRPMVVLGYFVR